MSGGKPKLCLVTTSPLVVQFFLVPLVSRLSESFDVTLVANRDCSDLLPSAAPPVRMHVLPIRRKISPRHDFAALFGMWSFLRREAFSAVVTVAPKAGLIGMVGAAAARIPFRCHVFQGEVWATRKGLTRRLLRLADRTTARLASEVLVVSQSERRFLVAQRVVDPERSRVLGHGSVSGIDTGRFAYDPALGARVRAEAGIPPEAVVVLFIGRIKREKGLLDLADAWARVASRHAQAHLAIVGPDEDHIVPRILARAGPDAVRRVHVRGLTSAPEAWHSAADIVVLPSYREGLGTSLLEAAAAGRPVIASRIYGITDAMVEDETGLLHEPRNPGALAACLERLILDPDLRVRLGRSGRAFVTRNFDQHLVLGRLVEYLERAVNMRRADALARAQTPGPPGRTEHN